MDAAVLPFAGVLFAVVIAVAAVFAAAGAVSALVGAAKSSPDDDRLRVGVRRDLRDGEGDAA